MIDDLYGLGSWERMQQEFVLPSALGATATFEQADMPDGGVRVIVGIVKNGSEIGQIKVDHYVGRAYVPTVSLVEGAQGEGISATMATRWGDYWESVGVHYVDASPTTAQLERMFQLIGAEPAERDFRWRTSGPDQRRKEYDAWKNGGAPEPDWHRELG